jgi:hypothetical protein
VHPKWKTAIHLIGMRVGLVVEMSHSADRAAIEAAENFTPLT